MFYLNSTLNFGIPQVLVFQLEVYYKVDRLLTGLTAQQRGTTAPWYSNKTSLEFRYFAGLYKIFPNVTRYARPVWKRFTGKQDCLDTFGEPSKLKHK